MPGEWEERLERWREELALAASLDGIRWLSLADAEAETGVSRSALRSWYRSGQIRTRIVDSPHGPQRLVQADEVAERAARSPRIRRRAEAEVNVEAQVALLRHQVSKMEARLDSLERLLSAD